MNIEDNISTDLSPQQQIQISKTLSWILRHGAIELNLMISPDGYIKLEEVLGCPQIKKLHLKYNDIAYIVKNNEKQRFALKTENGVHFIRANQGHSLKVLNNNLLFQDITDALSVECCIHGTFIKAWNSIKHKGLSRMNRDHIHFSSHPFDSTKIISGMRKNCEVLIYIDLSRCLQDNIPFFLSSNDVILSPGLNGIIPPQYFSHVEFPKSPKNSKKYK